MRIRIIVFCLLLIFISLTPAWSSQPDNQDAYHEWLKSYGAMDIYAMSLKEREAGPAGQLDYAQALISLGNPETAISVLKGIETKSDPQLEGMKHWTIHRALRQLGEFDQSVLAVIEASGSLGIQGTSMLMSGEPGLDILWSSIWKRWFFQTLNADQINDGRRIIMEQSVVLARSAWPAAELWKKIDIPIFGAQALSAAPGNDQIAIAGAFALWGIAHWDLADQALTGVSDPDLRSFFKNFGRFLRTSELDQWESNLKTAKSSGFTDVYADHLQKYALENFRLSSPAGSSWERFLDRIRGLSPSGALELIKKELSSALLPDEIRGRLLSLAFIYELYERPYHEALDTWSKVHAESPDLPFTFFIAASLIRQDYQPLAYLPASRFPFFKEVLNAAGLNPDPKHLSRFWTQEEKSIQALFAEFPLDYAVNCLYYNKSFQGDENQVSARNLAFLFPHSKTGQSAYLSLAQHAYREGNKALAWRYLQSISEEFARGPRQLELLEAKAGILMDMGREEESLSTYLIILEKSPQRLSPERRLRLALLAQEKNKWKLAQDMLEGLLRDRTALSEPVQAEVLFWLGEGAQHQGDLEQALDYYLRLSWQFPEQNIWAVTAMYRAGLIYEQREMLDTARNLFQTVLKSADRKSQKEAAQQRLDAIESRMGSGQDKDTFLF
jgi:hypothetical protein